MFLFVENLAGLHIATHSPALRQRRLFKFVSETVLPFAEPAFREHGWVVSLPQSWMRWAKTLLSLTQLPVIQQDPFSRAYQVNAWREVLSDGLTTEYALQHLGIRARRFYTVASAGRPGLAVADRCAIVGSNWLEFKSMSEVRYRQHLSFLKAQYPQATYFCHPRERNPWPEAIFGATLVERPKLPLEAHLRLAGLPRHLVGVCSTSLLALAADGGSAVTVDVVTLATPLFDGPSADAVFVLQRRGQPRVRVCVGDLQRLLVKELSALGVAVRLVDEPAISEHPP